MKPPAVTLYGQFNGHWSNAGVSRGLAAGLHANGVVLKAGDWQSLARLRAGGYARRYNWADLTAPLAKKLRELTGGGRTLAGRTVGR